jgi:hypothetical protein
MSKASRAMHAVKPQQLPYGYLYIDSSKSEMAKYPVSECELDLWHNGQSATLNFMVLDYGRRWEKKYSLFVFPSERRNNQLLASTVRYMGEDGMYISHETSIMDERVRYHYDLLIRALHVWIFDTIIYRFEHSEDDEPIDPIWYMAVTYETLRHVKENSPLGVPEMITLVNDLLRR